MSSTEIIRVLVLSYGAGFGKTSLVSRFLHNEFDADYFPTVGDIDSKKMTIDDEPVVLQILDSSGDPRFSETTTSLMKFADAFMVVYDTSQQSLSSCLPLRFSILQEKESTDPPMVLVGAKTDLKRRTRRSHGRALAESWGCPFFETSSRQNINVKEAFEQLVREYRARRRTFVHENKVSSFLSNTFCRLRSWDSSETRYAQVLKSGWLHKRGYVRHSWKFRHVVLFDDGTLQYFQEETQEQPLGELHLQDVWQVIDYREDQHEDAFVLQTKERDWYFSCLSETEKEAWMEVIVKRIAFFAANLDPRPVLADPDREDKEDDEDDAILRELSFEKTWSVGSFESDRSSIMSFESAFATPPPPPLVGVTSGNSESLATIGENF